MMKSFQVDWYCSRLVFWPLLFASYRRRHWPVSSYVPCTTCSISRRTVCCGAPGVSSTDFSSSLFSLFLSRSDSLIRDLTSVACHIKGTDVSESTTHTRICGAFVLEKPAWNNNARERPWWHLLLRREQCHLFPLTFVAGFVARVYLQFRSRSAISICVRCDQRYSAWVGPVDNFTYCISN